jgi:capsular exopolysaccharide synthesis family protein
MELKELLRALRRFWPLVALVILAALALGAVGAFVPKERFRSTATVIITPSSKQIDYATADTIRYLLPSIAAQANSETFARQVEQRLPLGTSFDGVSLSVSEEPGTSVLKVRAEAYDSNVAALAANAATDNLVQRKVSELINVDVIDSARPPAAAFSPDKPLILFATAAIGVILAVLAAVAAHALRPRVRTAGEIRQRFGLEIIGEIPNVRDFPQGASRVFDSRAGHYQLVEAFQRLRANTEVVAGERNVIAITSSSAGEGKSAVTANLAWAIAAMGREVVVVDTDLRRPTLHEYFHIRPGIGVADIPLGVDVQELAQPTNLPTLRVIAAGYATQHPTSILHSAVPKLLESFEDTLLVIDMPPVLATADAVLVATMVKAVVLVADARHGDPAELEQVLLELDRARAGVLGVVLNRTSTKRLGRTEAYYSEFSRRQGGTPPKRNGIWGRLFPQRPRKTPAGPAVASTTFPRAVPPNTAVEPAAGETDAKAVSRRARRT